MSPTDQPTSWFSTLWMFFFYSELIVSGKDLAGCQLSASSFISDGRLEMWTSSRLCGFTALNANTCCRFPTAESQTIQLRY